MALFGNRIWLCYRAGVARTSCLCADANGRRSRLLDDGHLRRSAQLLSLLACAAPKDASVASAHTTLPQGLEAEVKLNVYQVVIVLGQTAVVHVRILQVEFQILREEIVQTAFHLIDGC